MTLPALATEANSSVDLGVGVNAVFFIVITSGHKVTAIVHINTRKELHSAQRHAEVDKGVPAPIRGVESVDTR